MKWFSPPPVNEGRRLFTEEKEQNILWGKCFLRWLSLSQSCGPSGPNIHEYFMALATAKSRVSPSETNPKVNLPPLGAKLFCLPIKGRVVRQNF